MSAPKHTPGPWKAMSRFIWAGERRIGAADQMSDAKDATPLRNAMLMAAAPELAAALVALLADEDNENHECGDENCPVSRAKAALAKAGLR